ncbi:MAG: metallophosphoesterase family protein, partial [Clostridia bacterium]|nr:metallophosphoesterase family protein [Clostridia bacterium]
TLETAGILNALKAYIICVRGNCDSDVDQMVLEFPVEADFAVLPAGNRTVIATHGHKTPAILKKGDILLNGHSHVPAFEEKENCTYINCGSVSIPKENSPHSYLVLEGDTLTWKDVETGIPFKTARI